MSMDIGLYLFPARRAIRKFLSAFALVQHREQRLREYAE